MKPINGRYVKWASFAYFLLMGPIAVFFVMMAQRSHPELSAGDLLLIAGGVLVWPLQIPIALAATWYLGAFAFFAFWKYCELIQYITGIRLGQRIGTALANDRFLKNARPSGPYGWLFKKATQAYPSNLPGDLHV